MEKKGAGGLDFDRPLQVTVCHEPPDGFSQQPLASCTTSVRDLVQSLSAALGSGSGGWGVARPCSAGGDSRVQLEGDTARGAPSQSAPTPWRGGVLLPLEPLPALRSALAATAPVLALRVHDVRLICSGDSGGVAAMRLAHEQEVSLQQQAGVGHEQVDVGASILFREWAARDRAASTLGEEEQDKGIDTANLHSASLGDLLALSSCIVPAVDESLFDPVLDPAALADEDIEGGGEGGKGDGELSVVAPSSAVPRPGRQDDTWGTVAGASGRGRPSTRASHQHAPPTSEPRQREVHPKPGQVNRKASAASLEADAMLLLRQSSLDRENDARVADLQTRVESMVQTSLSPADVGRLRQRVQRDQERVAAFEARRRHREVVTSEMRADSQMQRIRARADRMRGQFAVEPEKVVELW